MYTLRVDNRQAERICTLPSAGECTLAYTRAILPAMAATRPEDTSLGEQISDAPPLADVVDWVREGERLFGAALQSLQQYALLRNRAERVEEENRQLRGEMQAVREELHRLRSERIEAAETLKAIAEHVTRLATVALQRLGKPVA